MRALILSVIALIASFGILLAGSSLQFVIVGLRAGVEGFSVETMGFVSAAYFVGFGSGCLLVPRLVARVGHIRTFAAFASIVSGAVLGFPIVVDPIAWIVIRLVTGFCFAGLYIVVESWLNAQASNQLRGRLLAIYGASVFGAFAIGPLFAQLGSSEGYLLFALASILMSMAVAPVALMRANPPMPDADLPDRLSVVELFRKTPLGLVGVTLVGGAQAVFISLSAIFGDKMGLDTRTTSTFISVALIAGLVFQYPIGMLSDRIDRRLVVVGVGLAGGIGCLAFALSLQASEPSTWLLLGGAIVTGVAIFPLYPIVLAHTNDWLEVREIVPAAATLILCYSAGSVLATLFAGWFMDQVGPPGLFLIIGSVMAALGVFALVRRGRRAAPETSLEPGLAVASVTPGTMPFELAYGEDYEDVEAEPETAPDQGDSSSSSAESERTA